MSRLVVVALAMSVACASQNGTVSVTLTTAPGSAVLVPVTRLRLTITHPHAVFETTRNGTGFDLAIDVNATGEAGELILEGFDAGGTLVATGMSPTFPIAALDAKIVIYVAAPMSIAAAPVALAPPRSEVAAAPLPYGAIFAGGRDTAGTPSDALSLYNVYDHTLRGGLPMPVARAGLVIAVNAVGGVYLFGGTGSDGNDSGKLLLFNTTAAPNGSYSAIGDEPGFARANQLAVRTAADRFLITGAPAVELLGSALTARTEIATLPSSATSVTPMDGIITAVFVGNDITRFRKNAFDIPAPGVGRDRAGITALPDGNVVIVGGGTASTARDLLVFNPATGTVQAHPAALTTGRFAPAIAATRRHLVVIGGVDATGAAIATAEVLDATTFASLVNIPIQPRTGAFAIALQNGQVLIAGGSPASELIELFTPDPP